MAASPLVPPNWQLPEKLRQNLGTTVGRQRLLHADQHLLIIAHLVPKTDETVRRGVLFWRDTTGEWRASNGEPGKVAIAGLLASYEKALEEYDQLESKAQRADEYLRLLEGMAPIVRASRNLSEVLQEARIVSAESPELIDLRDRAYEISRTAELLYQDAKNSMDVAVVRRAEEQARAADQMARSSHRLNILAAIFFPLATLGSIFGTTLTENWTWSSSEVPFLIFLLCGGFLGLILVAFILRKD